MAFSRLNKQNLSFYLNENEVHGVQDIQASTQLPVQHVKFLGMNSSFYTPEGPKAGNLSITSLLTTNNEFYNCTGDSGNFGFVTGAISSYGNFNSISTPSLVNTNTIDIGIGDFNTNRVSSFNLNLNINRNVAYYVGSDVPFSVRTLYPIEVNCDFNIAQDNYTLQSLSNLSYNIKNNPTFYIKTKDFLGNSVDFDFSNSLCYFINFSEDYSASVNSPVGITVRYQGYLK